MPVPSTRFTLATMPHAVFAAGLLDENTAH
jgi:hypothetical protein